MVSLPVCEEKQWRRNRGAKVGWGGMEEWRGEEVGGQMRKGVKQGKLWLGCKNTKQLN